MAGINDGQGKYSRVFYEAEAIGNSPKTFLWLQGSDKSLTGLYIFPVLKPLNKPWNLILYAKSIMK